MNHLIDLVVTRRPEDPRGYLGSLFDPAVNLIEVPFVPGSVQQARMNLVEHGSAPWVTWFDPDDELYPWTMTILIDEITRQPDLDGVMMPAHELSQHTNRKTITRYEEFTKSPAHAHAMRLVSRRFLEENVELFDNPVSEWAFVAKLMISNTLMLTQPGYMWIPGPSGHHTQISAADVQFTRDKVKEILGDKYMHKLKFKHTKRSPTWQS